MTDMFKYAITRIPAHTFARGMTTANMGKPSYRDVMRQHRAYTEALQSIGLEVIELDPLPEYPDAHFVEDTAVVTPEMAIITNPGALSRQGEEKTIAKTLASFRPVKQIQSPGTVDGGDVLMIDKHFLVGISERTNQKGFDQMARILQDRGNTLTDIPVSAGLHFKSSVNYVGKNTLIITRDFAEHRALEPYDRIVLDQEESYAANTLWVNDHLLVPDGFPKTRAKLETLDMPIIELDVSEMQKMDGGLTCLSIRF